MCLKVKPGAFSPSYGNNTHQISSRLLIITKHVYSNIYITHCFYLLKTPASAAGRNVRYSEENLGFICHYFFLLSSSPWQRWQVLVLFMTPNINDLLLYLCLIFLLDSNLCVPYPYIHVFLKCAFACYKKKNQFNWVSKVLN